MGTSIMRDWSDPVFQKVNRPVEKFDDRLWNLLDDMRETLANVGGYGCAAVHVGVLRRIVVVNEVSGVIELVNPVIISQSEETQDVTEGSIVPGAPRGTVIRPKFVVVKGFDRNGAEITVSGEDFLSATLCHEIDHLDGIIFTDKANKQEDK